VLHAPLGAPAALVLAGAVLQIQHRVARGSVVVIARRRIDQRPPPGARGSGPVPVRAHGAVRHILRMVVGSRRGILGHLDAAALAAIAKERLAARVVDDQAVDQVPVIVKAGGPRLHGDGPDTPGVALGLARHREGPLAQGLHATGEVQLHRASLRGGQAKGRAAIGTDAGPGRAADVGRGGQEGVVEGHGGPPGVDCR